MAHQISVFAENKPGRIERVTGVLAEAQVNIRAITVSSSEGFGVIKLLVDRPDAAYEALRGKGISALKKEILAIPMEDRPGGLHTIAKVLSRAEINMEDAYGFVVEDRKQAVLVVEVEQMAEAEARLREAGMAMLTDAEIYAL